MKAFFCLLALAIFESAGAQAGAGSAIPALEAQAALAFHNQVRRDQGLGQLNWSATLAAFAQAWASHLAETGCKLQHRPANGNWAQQYGENIFWGSGRYFDAAEAARNWYSEKKDFRYGPVTQQNYMRVGHYTQMMWSATTEVGMGSAQCANGAWIIVANYDPRGNYIGVKPY